MFLETTGALARAHIADLRNVAVRHDRAAQARRARKSMHGGPPWFRHVAATRRGGVCRPTTAAAC
jgi:hypothetical protein